MLKLDINLFQKKETNSRTKKRLQESSGYPTCGGSLGKTHSVMRKYGVVTAMCPHTTLRHLLVHPQDKVELAEQCELVYQIPCKNCGAEYIGETGDY